MGQGDVVELLKDGKWRNIKQISSELEVAITTASETLRRLFRHGEVFRKTIKVNNGWVYFYKGK